MADEKKPSASPVDEVLFYILIIGPLALVLLSVIFGVRLYGLNDSDIATSTITGRKSIFDVPALFGGDELTLGGRIINSDKVSVRTAPAGSIVGTQKKLEIGRLMEGPVEQFNTRWWRVDYPEAPDGWVEFTSISSSIKTVRLFNIVPLAYGLYKPIGYSFLILLILFFAVFKLRLMKEEGIAQKKMELKFEQYRDAPKTTAEIIRAKPDVQEIPGFQTEEIFPIQVAEKNNRWKHIQDLIKSYNVNDWKQAIIESDIVLEEMLEKMQYEGVSIGDKLKKVERSDFVTLDKAWAAHRVRNRIAHDGSSFKLTREIAENTIKDYEEVFREFYYI